MDPNRHHEFIGSNEERSSAMYFSRGGEDIRPHSQYFSPDRAVGNSKPCACNSVSGNIMCNGCRTNATDSNWRGMEHSSRADFRNVDSRDKAGPSSMYMPENSSGRSYWQHNNPPYMKEIIPANKTVIGTPHLERNVSSKSCTLDTGHNYKHQQMQEQQLPVQSNLSNPPNSQQQHHMSVVGAYGKERCYNDKYSARYGLLPGTKIGYASAAAVNTAIYNNVSCNVGASMEAVRSTKLDQNVINPSNMMALKEQQQSPNYARKCPEIFTPEGQNVAHHSLYMSTPQFSSDKFMNANTQKKMPRDQDYRGESNSTSRLHINSGSSKYSDIQMSSAPAYITQPKYHQINEPPLQPQIVQQTSCNSSSINSQDQFNYYAQGGKTHPSAPEIFPVIMKQTSNHYQYSKNAVPVSPSPSHMTATKSTIHDIVDYKKKEDNVYDDRLALSNRGLYVNPYNTPPSSDSCCKEITSPYTMSSNYRDGSPNNYYKYGKMKKETVTANKTSAENQNTPPQSKASSKVSMYFLDTQNMKFDGNPHTASSPAAATAASPSPSLLTSQTQIHHNDYMPQTPTMQPYHQHQTEVNRSVVRTSHESNSHPVYNATFERQVQQGSRIVSFNTNTSKSPALIIQSPQTVQTASYGQATLPPQTQNPKKSQLQKPNYRELINQAYAIRNATSEEELNRQIIKKTLNVDTQVLRTSGTLPGTVGSVAPSNDKFQQKIVAPASSIVVPVGVNTTERNYICDNYRKESVSARILPKTSVEMLPDLRVSVKQEDKLSSSPLDLSMRTVKTKADSTEYKYPHLASNSQIDYKYGLPRVDFTPNFALHTEERNIPAKTAVIGDRVTYGPKKFNHIPDTAFTNMNVTPVKSQAIKQFYDESLVKRNVTLQASFPSCDLVTQPVVQHVSSIVSRNEMQIAKNPLVIKTVAQSAINRDSEVCQMRPSVVETNPFATVKSVKTEPNLIKENVIAVDQLPPDTSIKVLPKTHVDIPLSGGVIKMADHVSAYDIACERNPNYLGRKRHLQEYSNSKMNEPLTKQICYQESGVKSEYIRPTEITVITVNERAAELERIKSVEQSIQAEISPCEVQASSISSKSEPVILPSERPALPVAPIKTETNSLIAARIRTKAELKGFTFNPPSTDLPSSHEAIQIKEEPQQATCMELLSIPGLNEEFSENNLLDCSWNNTCNNFMEQLLTSSGKKKPIKRKVMNAVKAEMSEDDLPVSTIALKNDSVFMPVENISNMESAETSRSFSKIEGNESTFTVKSVSQEAVFSQGTTAQRKISKQDREKLRLQQEKRIAARLQDDSSSESDNELDKRKSERLKKPLKKVKTRTNTYTEKHHFSDCGSDSSESATNTTQLMRDAKESNEQRNTTMLKALSPKPEKNDQALKGLVSGAKLEKTNSKSGLSKSVDKTNKTLSSEEELNVDDDCKKVVKKIKKDEEDADDGQKSNCIKGAGGAGDNDNSNRNKSNKGKAVKRSNLHLKVSLNTMTRSKRKREMELQLANSKVLRNDKIIRNSTTKIKRKYVRKFVSNPNSSSSKEAPHEQTDEVISTRLRSKIEKTPTKSNKNKECNNENTNKYGRCKHESQSGKSTQNAKGKEKDLFMEVYRFKRSLKVPPSLITIKHPQNHKMAASLPDLERDREELGFSNRRTKLIKSINKAHKVVEKKSLTTCKTSEQQTPLPSEEPRSIIDVLHSRVLSSGTTSKAKNNKKSTNNSMTFEHLHSETSQNTESNSVSELPQLKREEDEESNSGKKRHFSIFETKVLPTKTRTESKAQQRKEIIREIFVGDDRPASAPPEFSQTSDGGEKMTYEQKYEQFLQQLNMGNTNDDKLRRFRKGTTSATTTFPSSASVLASTSVTEHTIKQEDDTESASAIDADEKMVDGDTRDNVSYASSTMTNFRRRRTGKYLRRKGSSGFDYIRKKKKPASSGATSNMIHHSQILGKAIKMEEFDDLKTKKESDVCREIQKWVLNKSVGQSTMHKAARLGYIDVIVYCLDRMGMNPDQKDNAGYTPLHEACTKGWLEIARILLQYGANHSEAALSGIRPLHEASENDHEEIVRLLLSYGADPMLATYSGQTPLMLASSTTMRNLLNNYLSDVQNVESDRKPWRFNGPWEILDMTKCGYDVFGGAPNFTCDMSRALRKSSVSSLITNKKPFNQYADTSCKTVMDKCAVLLDNIDRFNSVRLYNDNKPEFLVENSDSEGEIFEFEEADVLLPPLYLLKDEGSDKWVLLSDLCNLLKVKSKDTLLNKIYPSSSSMSSAHKSLMRELKMSDFLEKATCLQLLCAGEKINICASKVVLIKYNDSVRNLLGVKTILMKF